MPEFDPFPPIIPRTVDPPAPDSGCAIIPGTPDAVVSPSTPGSRLSGRFAGFALMGTRASPNRLKKISQPGYLDDVFGEHHGTEQPALRCGVDFVEMTLVDG